MKNGVITVPWKSRPGMSKSDFLTPGFNILYVLLIFSPRPLTNQWSIGLSETAFIFTVTFGLNNLRQDSSSTDITWGLSTSRGVPHFRTTHAQLDKRRNCILKYDPVNICLTFGDPWWPRLALKISSFDSLSKTAYMALFSWALVDSKHSGLFSGPRGQQWNFTKICSEDEA